MFSQNAQTLKEQGNTAFKQQDYQSASMSYQQAVADSPNFVDAWSNLGLCYKKLNNMPLAIDAFFKTIELQPSHKKALYNLISIIRENNLFARPDIALRMFNISRKYQAKVCFLSADLKLTKDNRLVILEITRGFQSGYRGTVLRGLDINTLMQNKARENNFPELRLSPSAVQSLQAINLGFQQTLQAEIQQHREAGDITDFASYKFCCGGSDMVPIPLGIDILGMDDPNIALACEDKYLLHQLCVKSQQLECRPRTLCIERNKGYRASLLAEIKAAVGDCPRYVIKAPQMEESKGVIIVESAELAAVLPKLFKSHEETLIRYTREKVSDPSFLFSMLQGNMPPEIHMLCDASGYFLVEEYVPNKPIFQAGKIYDPTLRVFFYAIRNKGAYAYIPIDSYWRLPTHDIAKKDVDKRSRIIPEYSMDPKIIVAVSPEDQTVIDAKLTTVIPAIFASAMETDYIADFQREARPELMHYRYLYYANQLIGHGYYNMAEYCFQSALALNIVAEKYRVFHERGIMLTNQERYQDAIACFNTVLSLKPDFEPANFRRGVVYHHLGKYGERDQDFKFANPNQVRHFLGRMGAA